MDVWTKAQRKALKRVYDRVPLRMMNTSKGLFPVETLENDPLRMSYRQFRRKAYYAHSVGCVMVPWCRMWLGIEYDGYTHS